MNKKEKLYKEACELYLRQKTYEEGIERTPSGVLYRWIRRSQSNHPLVTPNSIVFVHYTGRLIDGSIFDTSKNQALPACFVVKDLIMGWQIALTRMREGDKMELFIPQKYGYGKQRVGNIPAYSTLIFELELLKAEIR